MGLKEKLRHELAAMAALTLYFGGWIGALLVIKNLVLAEYRIEFQGLSKAMVGALVLAKVVLVLEHVPLGRWVRSRPAWVDVVLRTALYTLGVVAALVLERGIGERHEHGGFAGAVTAAIRDTDAAHLWVNAICISASLLVYNAIAVIRRHLGPDGVTGLFLVPLPEHSPGTAPDAAQTGSP